MSESLATATGTAIHASDKIVKVFASLLFSPKNLLAFAMMATVHAVLMKVLVWMLAEQSPVNQPAVACLSSSLS